MERTVYTEAIEVTVDASSSASIERLLQQVASIVGQLEKIRTTSVAVQASQATAELTRVAELTKQVTKGHTITLTLHNLATAGLNAIETTLKTLARGVSIPVHIVQAAGHAIGAANEAIGNALLNVIPGGSAIAGLVPGGAAGVLPAAGIAGGIYATKQAADWQAQMAAIQNNTNMSASDISALSQQSLALARLYGGDPNQIALGGMHALNVTGDINATSAILDAATKSAISTGGDPTATANVLANLMHEFGLDKGPDVAAAANHAMGMLHNTSALSNLTLEDLTSYIGPDLGIAANLGIAPEEVLSAFGALTKHGYDPARSATQVQDMMTHMINPAKAQQEQIATLAKKSGIDLVTDFTAQGLSDKGLTGVIDDVKNAYEKTGLSAAQATQETMKLMNALRGGLGFSSLLGTGLEDYNKLLKANSDDSAIDAITNESLARTQGTLANQMQRLTNTIQQLAMGVGERLLPVLTPAVSYLTDNLPGAMDRATPAVQAAANAINGYLTPAVYAVGLAARALSGDWQGAVDQLKTDGAQAVKNVSEMLSQIKDWATATALPAIVQAMSYWTGAFVGWTAKVVEQLPAALATIATSITNWVTNDGSRSVGQAGESLGQALLNGIRSLLTQGLPALMSWVTSSIAGAAQGVMQNIVNPFNAGAQAGSSAAPTLPGVQNPRARGGWITEPVLGIGLRTGQTWSFGERGTELVTPNGGGRGASVVVNVDARGAEVGFETRIRQAMNDWGEKFVDGLERHLNAMPAAYGA